MRALFSVLLSAFVVVAASVAISPAQSAKCPPEVASAKAILTARGGDVQASASSQDTQAPRSQREMARSQDTNAQRSQDVQAPRNRDVQAPRNQDVQAPRNQDVQAPRNQDVQATRDQDVQAPRNQDVQAPRNQDVQAPRNQDGQSPRTAADQGIRGTDARKAQTLVSEAEAACRAGDPARASEKAMAALDILKKER